LACQTAPEVTTAGLFIKACVAIPISATLFSGRIIAVRTVTALLPNGATAEMSLAAAITNATVAAAAGLPGIITAGTPTTLVTATIDTAAG